MAFLTVTPDQLRELQSVCTQQSGQIEQVGTTVNSKVTGVDWQSPAAEKFRADWTNTHLPNLRRLQEALTELGSAAGQMATAYDTADQSYKGGS